MKMTKGWISHPGVFIEEEMDARGWNRRDLAYILQVPDTSIGLIISGKRGITHRMAKALGAAFDVSPDVFINLQCSYDKAMAQEPNPEIAIVAKLLSVYPIREMIRRGWIYDTTVAELEKQLINFFEVNNANEIPFLAHAAKKSKYEDRNISPIQIAWLYRVKQIAKSISVPVYSQTALQKILPHLQELLIEPEEARHVPKLLAECGVRLIFVEPLPNAGIDGACFWLNDVSPVIGMSLRYDRIDNFWFVLRHEIEHVIQGHGKGVSDEIIDVLEGEKAGASMGIPTEEQIANVAAAEFCVPQDKLDSFIKRKSPFLYEKDVIAFSKLNGIFPGLVVGQIQRKINRYDYLKKYQVKIRQFVLPGAIADGWGQSVPVSA